MSGPDVSRRRWVRLAFKTVLWTAILSTSAAGGAYVAARSNPFPPGVTGGPTAEPTQKRTVPPSPKPKPQVWEGTFHSVTYHDLYVGGRCSSTWKGTLALDIFEGGSVSGRGQANLVRRPNCSFRVAQQQVKTYVVRVRGKLTGRELQLRLALVRQVPAAGAIDLGGWSSTVFARGARGLLRLPVQGQRVDAHIRQSVIGENRDTFVASHTFRLECALRCP